MAVTDWIDKVAGRWSEVEIGGKQVKSYRVYDKADYPESISVFPSALTYITDLPSIQYSTGGPSILVYNGITEFHLFPNTSKGNYPALMLGYEKILAAAAAHVTLGGSVDLFLLQKNNGMKAGVLVYGSEAPHLGIIVKWMVKETLATLVVGA